MDKVARVGIDLAKKVFHVTAVDAEGAVVERKRLRRAGLQSYLAGLPAGCVVAMEACGGAHHWGRLAVRHGHRVLMMSPQFVAPYVKSNKNDVNDADAVAEASARPGMRFVGVKSAGQEHIQQLHRARRMAVRNRVAQSNQIHGFLLEYGIEAPKGAPALLRRLAEVLEDAGNELPHGARALLAELADEVRRLNGRIVHFEAQLRAAAQGLPACRRLMDIPGIGLLTATALLAAVGDAAEFRNGRQLAAWLGLVPRQHSTGGRPRLLGISKRGDRYLRFLLVHGARSALRAAARRSDRRSRWAVRLEERRGTNVATVALANKNARTAWAVLARQADFDANFAAKAA
ncbi:MAG: IS110 family transposase [Gammaproteobacteria bacterium]|nr:IS110 family transposase [Gammaproteobacteria bacterium]MDE0269690.1 IS110 family transposase [Gammaproteobacteria bacterium]